MENRQSLSSPDASSNRNPSTRRAGPHHSSNPSQEPLKISQDYQHEGLVVVKVEDEDEPYVGGDEQIPAEIHTGLSEREDLEERLSFSEQECLLLHCEGQMNRKMSRREWIDLDTLIIRVQAHRELYDSSHRFYKDNKKRDLIWMDIAAQTYPEEWEDLSGAQRNKRIKELKTKWKSVRDNYLRDLRAERDEQRSGVGGSRRSRYRHREQLEFLRPVFEQRDAQDNMPHATQEEMTTQSPQDQSEEADLSASAVTPGPVDMGAAFMHMEQEPLQESMEASARIASRDLGAGPSNLVTATAFRSSAVQRRAQCRRKNEEAILQAIRALMQQREQERRQRAIENRPSYHLAMSLIPLLDEVPKERLIPLQQQLLQVIGNCLPASFSEASGTSTPQPPPSPAQHINGQPYNYTPYYRPQPPAMQSAVLPSGHAPPTNNLPTW